MTATAEAGARRNGSSAGSQGDIVQRDGAGGLEEDARELQDVAKAQAAADALEDPGANGPGPRSGESADPRPQP